MTTAADTAAERAFEAALAGRAASAEAGGLTAFTEAVRASATRPGRPNTALAELLSTGLLVDQPSPSARTAKRRRRRMWFFTALIAKIASAGAVAQAATGAGIVLVGFTTAGVTGSLPHPVQHTFDSVVQTVTGSDSSTEVGTATETTPQSDTSTPTATDDTANTSAPTQDTAGTEDRSTHPDNFGGTVSDDAHDGGVDGRQISQEAHERNDQRRQQREQAGTAPEQQTSSEKGDDAQEHASTGGGSTEDGGSHHGDH